VFRKSSTRAIVYSTVVLCDRQIGRQNCHNIAYMPDALATMRRALKILVWCIKVSVFH